jgi:ankyrin repeat protein
VDAKKDIWKLLEDGDTDGLLEALRSDHDLARARDEQGISIILQAAYRRRQDMVKALVSHRDDLDVFEAAALGSVERVQDLIGREPNLARTWSPDGFTPLHLASFFGRCDCARVLIDGGAGVSETAKNPMAVTPLNSAAASGHMETVELLLKNGAEVDAAQKGGYTALHSAAHNGNAAMVELLLAHGADRERKAEDGRDAADLARETGHEALAKRLERKT